LWKISYFSLWTYLAGVYEKKFYEACTRRCFIIIFSGFSSRPPPKGRPSWKKDELLHIVQRRTEVENNRSCDEKKEDRMVITVLLIIIIIAGGGGFTLVLYLIRSMLS